MAFVLCPDQSVGSSICSRVGPQPKPQPQRCSGRWLVMAQFCPIFNSHQRKRRAKTGCRTIRQSLYVPDSLDRPTSKLTGVTSVTMDHLSSLTILGITFTPHLSDPTHDDHEAYYTRTRLKYTRSLFRLCESKGLECICCLRIREYKLCILSRLFTFCLLYFPVNGIVESWTRLSAGTPITGSTVLGRRLK